MKRKEIHAGGVLACCLSRTMIVVVPGTMNKQGYSNETSSSSIADFAYAYGHTRTDSSSTSILLEPMRFFPCFFRYTKKQKGRNTFELHVGRPRHRKE